jgi:hypothetical protein
MSRLSFRIAPTSQPWTNGHITIDGAGTKRSGHKFVILCIYAKGHKIARLQLKSGQIYRLVNALVDALETGDE